MHTLLLPYILSVLLCIYLQVALATLLSSYKVSLKPDHPVPQGITEFWLHTRCSAHHTKQALSLSSSSDPLL
jgi:hypothetical protein